MKEPCVKHVRKTVNLILVNKLEWKGQLERPRCGMKENLNGTN